MLRVLALCVAVLLPSLPAAGQDASAPANPAIESVIRSQIDAFLQDDFDTAFTFASPTIRELFQTPERFGTMVRQGYPMVWRPSDLQFLEARDLGSRTVQTVMITDASGTVYTLAYEMIETEAGWQINGVRILERSQLGA